MQNIILLNTEKLVRGGFQHGWPFPPPHWRNTGGWAAPVPTPMNFTKYLTDSLGVDQYRGIVWVKEEGSWRDLEMCVSPKGGQKPPSIPPP